MKKYGKITFSRCLNMFVCFVSFFLFFYSLPEGREASKNLPEARGSVFPKYEPEISILDPIQLIFVNFV